MAIRCNDANGSSADFNNAASLRTDPITAMHWVNNYADTGRTFLSVWDGSTNRAWRTSAATGPTNMRTRLSTDGANQLSTSSSTTIANDGTWYHMAFMYDGTDNEFWLNGVLDATSVDAGGLFASTADLSIGG
ncbi:MAG: LamG domain-containing protein, partial [Gammaproteobacteria bacterium]|nr:LamG domain-containing protein [Gammaproteobacteria bacterium]